MRGGVEPPALKIKPEGRGHALTERTLAIEGELALQERAVWATSGVSDCRSQRDQLATERVEKSGDVATAGLRLVFIQQGVVWTIVVAKGFCLPAFKLDDFFQPGTKAGEI